jgi:hypothetical protein
VLDAPNHQGKFGQDYIRVLASAAGLLVYTHDLDRDGIDLGFRFPGRVGRVASPTLEVQVKSWSRPTERAGHWHFDGLTEEQFNRLAGDDYVVPRCLFLVIVPSQPQRYTHVGVEGMLLRHVGFFHSLRDEPLIPRPDRGRRRPVRVPAGNVLTVRSLLELVHPGLAAAGGWS